MAKSAAPTYSDLQKQIAKLQAQAEGVRKTEIAQVVAQIRSAIEHYGLTAADLGLARGAASARKTAKKTETNPPAARKAKKFVVPVRYRDDQGNTWTGRGNKPRWLVAALAEGKKQEDFRVS